MVKLSLESNVTIQLLFDELTCCVFANIIQASANQVNTLFSLLSTLGDTYYLLGKGNTSNVACADSGDQRDGRELKRTYLNHAHSPPPPPPPPSGPPLQPCLSKSTNLEG